METDSIPAEEDQCHTAVSTAISIVESVLASTGSFSGRIPFKTLLNDQLETALRVAANAFDTRGGDFLDAALSGESMYSYITNLANLDLRLCLFARKMPEEFLPTIDALRHALHSVHERTPVEVDSTLDITEDGQRRRHPRRNSKTPFDWPYCAMCFRLTERANLIEANGGAVGLLPGWSEGSNARYCRLHKPGIGTHYQSALKAMPVFRLAFKSILEEIRKDSSFRGRFVRREDAHISEALWENREAIYASAAREPLAWSPIVSRIREYAYLIANRHPGSRTIEIARLMSSGKSRAQTATALGISVESVRQRIEASRGASFDFRRSSDMLIWWPSNLVDDPHDIPILRIRFTASPC